MKILAINASYRGGKGHTRFLVDKLFQGAREAGADCEDVRLAELKINRCLACNQCKTDESYLHCVYENRDDVWNVFQKMANADIVIYATPIYVLGISGLLKLLLERFYGVSDPRKLQVTKSGLIFHHVDHDICSTPFVPLICCDNIEAEMTRCALHYFRSLSRFADAPIVGELARNSGQILKSGRAPEQERWFPKVPQIYAAFEQAGRELGSEGHIRKQTQRRAVQDVIPMPLFGILKHLPSRRLKERIVENAQRMRPEMSARN